MTACTDSNMNRLTFPGFDFAPAANFDLLKKAYDAGTEKGLHVRVGNVLTADVFIVKAWTWLKNLQITVY